MKTTNKILLLSAVALALTAVSQAKAGEALLSPRAQGNQIKHVTSTANDANLVQASKTSNGALLSPRAQGNQIARVAGTNSDPDLVTTFQSLPGSPKDKAQQAAPVYQIAPVK
jgi:hypothetical protein